MIDPRKADTLDEAVRNEDDTYDGARALSWLSDVLTGGKGVSEDEIRQMFADAKAGRADNAGAKGGAALREGEGQPLRRPGA